MVDNVAITAGTGTTVATDDVGGFHHQRVKLSLGTDGTAVDAVAGAGAVGTGVMRVTLASDDPLVAKTAALGNAAAAASNPVVLSTEDIARLGIITETAPASDTASSGLNGRLQRVAQRITSLIALLPAALGSTAAASSLAVTASTEDIARIGATNETAAATDTTTSGLNGLLKRIAQNLSTLNTTLNTTNTQLPSLPSGAVQATITRPANVTAYTAGDVLGGAITLATGLTSGQKGMILSVDLQGQIAAIPTGMTTFRLHLYNVTPPSALADNAAFDLPSGDRTAYLGFVTITAAVDLGATIHAQVDAVNRPFVLSGSANLFAYLETVGGFTPAANSEVYLLRCHFLGI